ESLSDRISEFGFRIHGSSEGEEDLEDEDDDPDDSGIRDEIIIPNDLSNINMMNLCQLSSNTSNIEGISPTLSRMNTNDNSMDTVSTKKLSLSTIDGTNLNRYWSSCAWLIWNDGFPTLLDRFSVFTKPVKELDIRFSSSQFRKQR
ncbi:unnamed protein product, partial [Schistosoma curassoni]|uniref:HSF_DOMAIN domain-containing protein n=1 Tax=Schistosoma curassoni TaxID=6186 RepID=A0A183KFR6_9TREM